MWTSLAHGVARKKQEIDPFLQQGNGVVFLRKTLDDTHPFLTPYIQDISIHNKTLFVKVVSREVLFEVHSYSNLFLVILKRQGVHLDGVKVGA